MLHFLYGIVDDTEDASAAKTIAKTRKLSYKLINQKIIGVLCFVGHLQCTTTGFMRLR